MAGRAETVSKDNRVECQIRCLHTEGKILAWSGGTGTW